MRILERRNRFQAFLYFVRWQLLPTILALPDHLLFVLRGVGVRRTGAWKRLRMASGLCRIHLRLPCAHAPLELLTIVEEILLLPTSRPGAVVECGTWLGGSTAKLSLACALADRRLFACDSFQGLPPLGIADQLEHKQPFAEGDFASRLEIVRENVRRFGNLDVVEIVPGWCSESLLRLDAERVTCVFLDVDLRASIEDCLRGLWNRLVSGSKIFVHDVDRPGVVGPFRDKQFWAVQIGSQPPDLVGAETGMGRLRPLLGYAVKS